MIYPRSVIVLSVSNKKSLNWRHILQKLKSQKELCELSWRLSKLNFVNGNECSNVWTKFFSLNKHSAGFFFSLNVSYSLNVYNKTAPCFLFTSWLFSIESNICTLSNKCFIMEILRTNIILTCDTYFIIIDFSVLQHHWKVNSTT